MGPVNHPSETRSGHPPRLKSGRLIWIASLGTIFEWYDFFLYGAVATLLSKHFFPAGNSTASFLLVLATFGAGFAVRPLGAMVFGSLGDRIGRKRTFVTTMVLMGLATAAIGMLPTYGDIGVAATVALVALRLVQGFSLGGEYGGAAIYVAEHAPRDRRGLHTSWIQLSAAIGFLLSLTVTVSVQRLFGPDAWEAWAWRIPFLVALPMLSVSIYLRLRLHESPVFERLRSTGAQSRQPLRESLADRANLKRIAVGLFGVAAGQTVIWFTAQFSSLYLLQRQGGVDDSTALTLMAVATLIAAPSFVLSGWLSDRIGRKRMLMLAYVLGLVFIVPVFLLLPKLVNPAQAAAIAQAPVTVQGSACNPQVFAHASPTECTAALTFLRDNGVPYALEHAPAARPVMNVGGSRIAGFDPDTYRDALRRAGYLREATLSPTRAVVVVAVLVLLIGIAGAAYGPNAALLVELFPAKIRYTSLSVAYHLGTGYFGGFQPLITQYIAIRTGSAVMGLTYPMAVLAIALVVCAFGLPRTERQADEG
jgi:MFS family permease